MNVKFSIITPVYNVEKYLDECIQSVLAQTYTNYELILVNDGSKDSSGEICDRYAQKHSQIKVFHKKNQGLVHTRQFGIARANGDYYLFLDSDDYLSPDALQVISDAVLAYECDCVVYGMQRVYEGRVLQKLAEIETSPIVIQDKRELYRKVYFDAAYNSLCRKAFRASFYRGLDFSDVLHIQYAEDLLQSIELLKKVEKVVFLPDILYNYRLNTMSITQTINHEKYSVDFTVRERVLGAINEAQCFTEEDYAEYRAYSIWRLIDELETICSFNVRYSKKKALFIQLAQAPYCREFITRGRFDRNIVGKKVVLYDLFKAKRYMMVIGCAAVFRVLRKMLRN